jgi:hypothetical protein
LVLRSGVGTQMFTVSSVRTTEKSVVAVRRPCREIRDVGGRNVGDVRLAAVDGRDLRGVEIDPDDVETCTGQFDGEREADVAESDHAGARRAARDAFEEVCSR